MEWRQYNDKYTVSEYGDVKNIKTGRIRKLDKNSKGYLRVNIYLKHKLIHRLVCTLWHQNPDNKPETNHLDGNKLNNHYSNLCWSTELENRQHALDNGLILLMLNGEDHFAAKLTNDNVRYIKQSKGIVSARALAEQLNTKTISIYKIWEGKMWKSIN